ncbi:unnamed protein product [Durusdinium trenchii]|uniref:Uncharacterized protein n=1 Tax=Durusdinium trenchii TaxID=1381693 RepID=A0ABP0M975_9DINO
MSIVNDTGNPAVNATLACFPDIPKDSSLRGLYDEEKSILEACFGFRQHVETRWVDLLTRERHVESRSNVRRFSTGRLVVNGDSKDSNILWLQSELAVCGRPVSQNEQENGAPTSVLPKASSLLLPEGSSPDSDLRISERNRPSPEQQSAQKGAGRLQLLLESLVKFTPLKRPVLLVNWTGYVEEVALAVLNLRIKGPMLGEGGGFNFSDTHYLSCHTLDSTAGYEYARRRVLRELLDAWLQKRISFEGRTFEEHDEMKAIPGAEFVGSIDSMGLKVCVRQGTAVVIHPDQEKQWKNSGQEFAEQFAALKQHHETHYQNLLSDQLSQSKSAIVKATAADSSAADTAVADPEPPSGPGEPSAEKPVTFESEEKLVQSDPIETRCGSEVSGVELIRCKSGKIYVMADKARVVPRWTLLGGFGTGKHL